jgi:hypothetical protein
MSSIDLPLCEKYGHFVSYVGRLRERFLNRDVVKVFDHAVDVCHSAIAVSCLFSRSRQHAGFQSRQYRNITAQSTQYTSRTAIFLPFPFRRDATIKEGLEVVLLEPHAAGIGHFVEEIDDIRCQAPTLSQRFNHGGNVNIYIPLDPMQDAPHQLLIQPLVQGAEFPVRSAHFIVHEAIGAALDDTGVGSQLAGEHSNVPFGACGELSPPLRVAGNIWRWLMAQNGCQHFLLPRGQFSKVAHRRGLFGLADQHACHPL